MNFLSKSCFRVPLINVQFFRNYRTDRVVTTPDGSIVVAWHPEPKFPYELSSPMPRKSSLEMSDSVGMAESSKLKVNYVQDMKELYHKKHERLVRRDLMRLTWTTKHRWFIRQGYRKEAARKNPREKPYL